ncbi:MAG: double-strand break repair protein AddB [Rhodobacterales bacterium]|nr:MAG: double-strand break repair protein AddB [Rhodobacterales bacterium]
MRGLYALPPGVDFAREVVTGLRSRLGLAPEALAKVELFVNTRRMQRRIRDVLSEQAGLLPRLRLITDPGSDPTLTEMVESISNLRRRLDLTRLVMPFLEAEADLNTRHAGFALADSLAALLSEMEGEGIGADALSALDVSDDSGHWARALDFVRIAFDYAHAPGMAPGSEARQRAAVRALIARWEAAPPQHPVIIAGSTGSRGTTLMLMDAVAKLPQGAVILPGVDLDMGPDVWAELSDPLRAQDHPQYRFHVIADQLGLDPSALPLWTDTAPASPARNQLVSLAMRPAPVTDAWRREGPLLGDLSDATRGLSLIEAPSPRIEAEAIALRLARAAQDGQSAALVTPDRVLTRQVAATLARLGITPDDSAGEPLHLSAPGRLLRQVAQALCGPVTAEALLAILKHPLAHSGADRGKHLRKARAYELHVRRHGPPHPDATSLAEWAGDDAEKSAWAAWVGTLLDRHTPGAQPLAERVAALTALAQDVAGGPEGGSGLLWEGEAGRAAHSLISELTRHADAGADLGPEDFAALLHRIMIGEEVHRPRLGHPLIRIWGTLEARVQSTDLLILGGLNEGTWPSPPDPDPWLNRRMRAQAGMLLPDRRIGLLAHDFQQAIAAPEVVLTRAIRNDEAQTVPARWLNRLTNLLDGLDQGAPRLAEMRARGAAWVARAQRLDRPTGAAQPAPRPSPRVPVGARPKRLRITDLALLARDPYAIYARGVLRLGPLDPLVMSADARIRGIAVHEVMERFVTENLDPTAPTARADLMALAERVLHATCPWPTARLVWLAQLDGIAGELLKGEQTRLESADQRLTETTGELEIPGTHTTLRGRADRIDLRQGGAWLYDYKTGEPPTRNQQFKFDRQLLVEAALMERGAFPALGPRTALGASYLKVGSSLKEVAAPLADLPVPEIWDGLVTLLTRWRAADRGYTARMAAERVDRRGDYDQLSRFGEWGLDQPPTPEDMPEIPHDQ